MFNTNIYNAGISNDDSLDRALNNLSSFDYNAFYRAFVVDNNDAERLGRVKVRIPAIHGVSKDNTNFASTASLPWATPAIFSSAGNDSGSYLIPNVGDMVFVTFEAKDKTLPIYFGGIPLKKGTTEKSISSYNINKNQAFKYNDDDMIKDIKNNTERVIYKSLKGAVIMIDDYDSEEYIKIIDQSGQEIMMQNYDVPLDRRGSDLGVSKKYKITITNNHGDVITLKNDKTYIKSKSLIIESEELDMPGLNRDFSQEAALADLINGEEVVAYNSETDSTAIVYQDEIDKILGTGLYSQVNKNIIDEAIKLTEKINNEIITSNIQTDYSDEMVEISTKMTEDIM